MTALSSNEPPFLCSRCGDRAPYEGTCPRCEEDLVDTRIAQPWQLPLYRQVSFGHPRALLFGSSAMFAVLLPMVAFKFDTTRLGHRDPRYVAYLVTSALMILFHFFAQFSERRLHRRLADRFASIPITPIAGASGQGPVHISGTSRVIHPACHPGSPPLLAYATLREEQTRDGLRRVETRGGGEFSVTDGSGVIAIVRANYVMLPGVERAGEIVIPAGARVEVIGHGRWEQAPDVSTDELVSGNLRTAPRVLRIEGTSKDPVLLRVIEAPPESAGAITGVRVDAASPETSTATEAGAREENSPASPHHARG